jgi:hypothetical protein
MTGTLLLLQVAPELNVLILEADSSSASEIDTGWAESGLTVRVVRGGKMRSYAGLFDEFAAALQFPWYFGENGNAFDECIADLSWLPRQSGYVLVIADPQEVLADTEDDGLSWLVGSLSRANEEWATPVELGEWWDRPAVPFHVVLQCGIGDAAKVSERWAAAGAVVVPLEG